MTKDAKSFLEALSRDKELLEKIKEAPTTEAVIALAAEKGFALTAEDLKPAAAGELSDDDLDGVAGGTGNTTPLEGIAWLQKQFR